MIRVYHSVFAAVVKSLAFFQNRTDANKKTCGVASRANAIVDRRLRRAICVVLLVSLFTTSTPAAPQTIAGVAKEWQVSLAFWFRANGLPATFYRGLTGQGQPRARAQEKQQDRDVKVSLIQIHPGDVTVQVDEGVSLAAIGYDRDGTVVSGLKITWSARDESRDRAVRISAHGEFESARPGEYEIIAQGAGRSAHVKVTVVDGTHRPKATDKPVEIRHVSNRDRPQSIGSLQAPEGSRQKRSLRRGRALAHGRTHLSTKGNETTAAAPAPMPQGGGGGWNDGNRWSSSEPGNQVGDPPGGALAGGAGSSNFQFAAPIYSSAGRGINISLGAAYNSRLWNKAGTQLTYNIDRGWPAPGWSVGFGKLLGMGTYSGSMIIDADGTRHSYSGNVHYYNAPYSWAGYFQGHTTDGTFIDYYHWTNSYGWIMGGWAKLANGTIINYGANGPGGVFPTSIEDPNGNYITITYVGNHGPQIETITDSLGRAVNFDYDSNNLLTAITGPGLNGTTRTLIRFHYRQLSLAYSFSGMQVVVENSYPWVVDAIYYPSTRTGYWFDTDSYSSYGMLKKVSERRNMTFSGPEPVPPGQGTTEQGAITDAGQITKEELYNYPGYVGDPNGTQSSYLGDAPTYTTMTETWTRDGVSTDQSVTQYAADEGSSPRAVTITLPNGTKSRQLSYNAPGSFLDGLVYHDETFVTEGQPLQSSSSTWQQGDYESPRPTHVEATNELGQTTATDFVYNGPHNQPTGVLNYDYSGALLRSTQTQYQNSSNYTNRHIFNLPLTVEVYANDQATRVSRTEYQYDSQTLTDAPGVPMHQDASNPYAPPIWIEGYWEQHCDENGYCQWDWVNGYYQPVYDPATDYRGNVTQATTYADALNLGGAITETRRYDITGNMVKATSSCCQQTTLSFTDATHYAYPESQTRGSATDPYAQVTTSGTYDFNTGLGLSATDANGRTSQSSYDAATLRPQTVSLPSGSHSDYVYDDAAMTVTESTYLSGHPADTGLADQSTRFLNGLGQVRQEKALGANGVWDFVDTVYDNLGRVSQQSRPYRSGVQWSTPSYDALGRVTSVQAPDGSTTQTFYNETNRPSVASSSSGETTRVRDAWGRERWGRTDASGRLVEVVEPNPSGNGSVATGGLVTTYAYNTLGNLTQVTQGAQTRSFSYDSLGRLKAQKLAEQSATLNDAGTYIGAGTWSDIFTYDDRSNLTSRTDARGVKTVYSYNSDPLNRLQTVSWDTSGFGDTANPILPAAPVSYTYRTKSSGAQLLDVTQLGSVSASGISTESYVYDAEGRVSTQTATLTSRSSYPMVTNYSYDYLDRATDVRYPAEYGNGNAPRKVVHHDYDIAGRLSSLTFDGQSFASSIVYNASSQTTSLNVGSGINQIAESYSYNAQTGLLDNQTVARGATALLNLSYDYADGNGKRTGQLTKILNNLNHNKDRSYTYDALGRLTHAAGGPTGTQWTQTYAYDRYGNRTSVTASGYSAWERGHPVRSEATAEQIGGRGSSLTVREGSIASAIAQPSEPKVELPTDLLARNNSIELPPSFRDDSQPISDSPPTLRAPNKNSSRLIARPPIAPQSGPAKIAFASDRDGSAQIYTMNTDGTGQTRVTNNATNDESPRWSPDNSRLVFQSDRDNPFCGIADIYVMNADGSGQTRLTSDAADDSAPVWSADGAKIAFQSARNGVNYQVFVMNADGSGQVNLSNSSANDSQPSWSLDGTKIAFASDRDHSGTPSIYVMNANGSNQTRLTFSGLGLQDGQPAWSPDGMKLAFTSTRDSTTETWQETDDDGNVLTRSRVNINKEVYVMNADGSNQTRLTNTLENDDSASWSGDGTKIVFRSDRERESCDPVEQVWVMNADGSNQVNLSNNKVGDYSPNWQHVTSNVPPAVNITSPINGASFTAPANIGITASASDSDGTISRVDFYQGTTLIGTDTTAPYSLDWNSVAVGSYSLTAKATDNAGGTSTSAPVSVTVNAAAVPIPGDGLANISYDAATNRINSAGFAYDAAGNQVRALAQSGGSQRFRYDAANRLVQVLADDNTTVLASYTYGDSNERLIAEESGLRTYYVWGGTCEYIESGGSSTPTWSKSYVYLGSRLLSTLTPNGSGGEAVQYHHPDRLGTRLVTNAQDTSYFEQQTLPFGTALNESPPTGGTTGSTNKRFTSYDRSATTGLDYAVNRHYDAQQGRFTQVDPAGMKATSLVSPQTLNLYAYCSNDPINHTDPSGLGFFSKLWHAIKKILTNKWFVIALTIALAVITIGAGAGLWSLTNTVFASLGSSGFGGEILIAAGHTATALGWAAIGIGAALAVPGINFSFKTILGNALTFGLGWANAHLPRGNSGPGGTPPFAFQKGATEQPLTPVQGALLYNALEEAKRLLRARKECMDYVGEGADKAIDYLWGKGRFTYFNGAAFDSQGEAFAETGPRGLFSASRIVLGYHFFRGNAEAIKARQLGLSNPFDSQVQTILHEMKHYMKWIEISDHPGGGSQEWDKQITQKCFK